MTHSQIVATYTTPTLAGIIRTLRAVCEWSAERLQAAKQELATRQSQELQQDQESFQ